MPKKSFNKKANGGDDTENSFTSDVVFLVSTLTYILELYPIEFGKDFVFRILLFIFRVYYGASCGIYFWILNIRNIGNTSYFLKHSFYTWDQDQNAPKFTIDSTIISAIIDILLFIVLFIPSVVFNFCI